MQSIRKEFILLVIIQPTSHLYINIKETLLKLKQWEILISTNLLQFEPLFKWNLCIVHYGIGQI